MEDDRFLRQPGKTFAKKDSINKYKLANTCFSFITDFIDYY